MLNEKFIFLAVVFNLFGGLSYLIATIKGKAKPNKVSWFFWGLAPMIAFAAQVKQGVGLSSLMTFAVGFSPILIFFASFLNKKAEWKITKFDLICGALSLLGLLLWAYTRVGNVAILFGISADLIAGIPTLVKAYKYPETENYRAYFYSWLAAIVTLLTIKNWGFAYSAFAIYIFAFNSIAFPLIKFKLGKKFSRYA